VGVLTPPTGLLARTRWLFLLAALIATGILGPLLVVVGNADWPHKLAACAALAVAGLSWVLTYRRGRLWLVGDTVEAVGLVIMGTTLYFGLGVLVPALTGVCFRSLYGSGRRVALGAAVYGGAFIASMALAPRQAFLDQGPIRIGVSLAFLAVLAGAMHVVAVALRQHEEALVREQGLRRELEASNRALTRATQAKNEFLGRMSHELRTPLNAIVGFSELLLLDAAEDAEERARYSGFIHESSLHLLSLVNDLLDVTTLEAERVKLAPTTFDVATALEAVAGSMRPLAQKQGLTLETHVAPAVGTVYADERRFRQVLFNLVSNAVKFTPEGGRVEMNADVHDGALEVVVADTGVGIPPDDQRRIFEPFEQSDSAGSRQQEGTGLGLALSRRLVELQGGRIWLESTPGEGSRFHFTLPLHAAPARRAEPGAAEG
jgi:signal transduction histidine kinase